MKQRQELVLKLIEDLKTTGKINWQKPWQSNSFYNPVSGAEYKGANIIYLGFAGNKDPRYMTFIQAKSAGYKIKKGAKGIRLEKFIFEKEKTIKTLQNGKEIKKKVTEKLAKPIIKSFTVFNGKDIEGLEEYKPDISKPQNTNKELQQLIDNNKIKVDISRRDRAFYSEIKDTIFMPLQSQFTNQVDFENILMHEMIHYTGVKKRADRVCYQRYGKNKQERAKEELVAELGSMFLAAKLGIEYKYEDSKEYIRSWIANLKDNPNILFACANMAEKSIQYLETAGRSLQKDKKAIKEIVANSKLKKTKQKTMER